MCAKRRRGDVLVSTWPFNCFAASPTFGAVRMLRARRELGQLGRTCWGAAIR